MSTNPQNPYAAPSQGKPIYDASGNAPLATLGQRFLGALVDVLIMLPIAFVLGLVLGLVLAGVGINPANGLIPRLVFQLICSLFGIGVFLAINGFLLANKGQTVGKMVIGTRIVSDSGEMVPFQDLILKRYLPIWLVGYIPYLGGVLALVNVLLIFRENRKCFHDDLAGTKVIQVSK